MATITCKKLHMTQTWQEEKVVPVTVLLVDESQRELLSSLEPGMRVTLVGKSKGKGFQGVVKRHGFAGGPKSHGQKHSLRAPGSIGATGPQRTIPGRKMPGRMGGDRITLRAVRVIGVDVTAGTIMIKGPVPGMAGVSVTIQVPTT